MTTAGPNRYVRRGGPTIIPPPWNCEDVRMYVFYLEGKIDVLQSICDRCFNDPSRGVLAYKPKTKYVILTLQSIRKLQSILPDFRGQGYISESEATFWIIVSDHNQPNYDDAKNWATIVPYIFTDNALAVAAGRETYGFPKEQADVLLPEEGSSPLYFEVRGLASDIYDESREIISRTILSCDARPNLGARDALLYELKDVLGDLLSGNGVESPINLMKEFFYILCSEQIKTVFLKQFRGVSGSKSVSYQAIVEASHHDLDMTSIKLLNRAYELTLPSLASHPIAADLGLTVSDETKVDVLAAAVIEMSFVLGQGRVLWELA